MKNHFQILIIFLAFFSIGTGFLVSQKITQQKNYTIYITKSGFSFDTIEISKGDRVTWINRDSREHWPASNFHPQHAEYLTIEKGCLGSALDSCRGLNENETFSFTFDKVGTWGMHDHLYPSQTMLIKVGKKKLFSNFLNISDPTGSSIDDGLPAPNEFSKLTYEQKRSIFAKLIQRDPKFAWSYLKSAAIKQGEVVDNVHEYAHAVGRALYVKYDLEGIPLCSNEFLYGCYHGAVSEALIKQGVNDISKIESSCMNIISKREGDPGECIHGIGHGLLAINGLSIVPSLVGCDSLEVDINKEYCYQGVFMENKLSDTSNKNNEINNNWSFCEQFLDRYQSACTAYIVNIFGDDDAIQQAGSFCKNAPNKILWRQCMISVSLQITISSINEDEAILDKCRKIKDNNDQSYCIIMAAAWVKRLELPNNLATSKLFCQEVPLALFNECQTFSFFR